MNQQGGRNHAKPVPATPSASQAFVNDSRPGEFLFNEARTQFAFTCPCGCGAYRDLPIHRDGTGGDRGWLWNGDLEQPTLYPSIRDGGGCRWHGYLRAGVFEPVADSGRLA